MILIKINEIIFSSFFKGEKKSLKGIKKSNQYLLLIAFFNII
jgi:hypothetical protein